MNKEIKIPEGYEARIEGNKVILEPKESEDERIRTRLIALVEAFGQGTYKDEMLAYLKKQKEQKPAEWSEEDKVMLNNIIWSVHMKSIIKPLYEMDDRSRYKKYEDFLKALPERFNLQPNWKPSEEQMAALLNDEYMQEQPEVDLEKFTEKIKTFQGRYKHPENISVKGAMAFMARMFYQYPNVARQWYDSLPKATMDDARKEE